jgi:bacterioferritin
MNTKKLIDLLNYDLAGELQAIIQYLQHSYQIAGVNRPQLHDVLEEISKDEMKHAEELAERIVAMGGTPTIRPRPIVAAKTIKDMLTADLKGERLALKDYAERIKQAEKMGEIGTALIIENILVDEQHHADKFVMLLRQQK